jgi:hypothetical protein
MDLEVLPMCSEDDFKEIGIPKGPRIKLLRALTTQPVSAGESGHSRAPRTPQQERPHLAPVGAGRVPADGTRDLDDETRHVHRSLSHELIAGTPPSPHPNTTHQHRRLVRHTASIPGSFQYQYETFLH